MYKKIILNKVMEEQDVQQREQARRQGLCDNQDIKVVRVKNEGPTLADLGLEGPNNKKRKRDEDDTGPKPIGDDPTVKVSRQDGGAPENKKKDIEKSKAMKKLDNKWDELLKILEGDKGLTEVVEQLMGADFRKEEPYRIVGTIIDNAGMVGDFLLKCGQYSVIVEGIIRKLNLEGLDRAVAKLLEEFIRLAHEVHLQLKN
jgi:hypothetical protein